jgi:hypothetical protein
MSDVQFMNMDSWRGSGGKNNVITFKQIILMHINKCVSNGSVEWHGGYWQEKAVNNYTVEKIYVQNSREVFCNSITMLRCILLGYFDQKMTDADKEIQQDLKLLEDNYKKAVQNNEKNAKSIYLEDKIGYFIVLFEQLILLSKRLNFFEEEAYQDEL